MSADFRDLSAAAVSRFHDSMHSAPGWAKAFSPQFDDDLWKHIELNHRCNSLLWAEEDLARRKNVADSKIAANKRAIDAYNQQRNDTIESIDEAILLRLAEVVPQEDAWPNSETAGSIIDRLSISSLKIHHMGLQTRRTDVDETHIAQCKQKLSRLTQQRKGLQTALDHLLAAAAIGRAYFRIYRQFKMYNDPKLNPQLYKSRKKSGPA